MKGDHDFHHQAKCNDCNRRSDHFFCRLPIADLKQLESIKATKEYPKGGILLIEGQPSNVVYLLCEGKVKLSTCSQDGKTVIIDIAEPGDMIGLSAAVNGVDYETTAETLEACKVSCIRTTDLLRFLKTNSEACLNAVRQLSRNYHAAYQQIRALGLSDSVAEKLAKLFLGWSGNGNGGNGRIQLKNSFTHEEMAEMIGVSRETVTRALRHFRERGLVTIKGSDLVIHDRQKLIAAIG
jgi:CRP/FNR family transcriptional regulator